MNTADHRFYITGGSLPADNPSYVERRADRELFDALRLHEFCYVLTARQMGKSSLMVRTAARLRAEGVRVAVLDLTAIGQNVSPEQWYYSLLCTLAEQSGQETALEAFWFEHQSLGPLRRFMVALERMVVSVEGVACPVVVFVDEIDAVRSLPFSTDEFFAAIRECYNRRGQNPALNYLTFCLLGTAAPTDLIRDTRMTPFNIGQRIELTDFSEGEAGPLAVGLEVGELGAPGRPAHAARSLLKRVLYWTAGHPYLTQKLCKAVAATTRDRPTPKHEQGNVLVDRLCEALFLARSAPEKDGNLIFVRDRLLRSEADLAALLDLYWRVLSGKRVLYDETDPLCSLLRLSGIVRVRRAPYPAPRLAVRNRIYARVFDRGWITECVPDSELRRQRAAYRRGLVRATVLSGVVVCVLGGFAWTTHHLADDRRQALLNAGDIVYVSQMNLAHLASREGKIVRAQRLLDTHRPSPGQPDRRDFAWRYLWRLCRSGDSFAFPARVGEATSVGYSPDGKVLVSGGADGVIQLWDTQRKQLIASLPAHQGAASAAISPDGRIMATAGQEEGTLTLWDLTSDTPVIRSKLPGWRRIRARALFTPDGATLIAGGDDNLLRLWDLRITAPELSAPRIIPIRAGGPFALSTDGSTLAVGTRAPDGGAVTLWDIRGRKPTRLGITLAPRGGLVECIAFSPDGTMLATGSGRLIVWDVRTGRPLHTLAGHVGMILAAVFSSDGKRVASSGLDGAIRLWDPRRGRCMATLQGHTGRIASIAFSPHGDVLASASKDGTVRLWDTDLRMIRVAERRRSESEILSSGADSVGGLAFSPDGKLLSEVRARSVRLWNMASRSPAGAPLLTERAPGRSYIRRSCEFSPDGKLLAAAGADGSVRLWEVSTYRELGSLRGSPAVVTSLAFTGGLLAAANGGGNTGVSGSVRLWDVASRRSLAKLPGESRAPQGAVAVSPDGGTIALAGPEHRVELWDAATRRRTSVLDGDVQVLSLAFSPNGQFIAAGETEGSIYLWDRTSGRQVRRLAGHVGPCLVVAFSREGTLASGGMDGKVRLWNPKVDQEEATLTAHTDWVWSLAFSPDGDTLASGSPDGTVRFWRAAPLAETDAPSIRTLVGQSEARAP